MGINFVVIVENSRGISLEEFKEGLLQDPVVGPYAWNAFPGDDPYDFPPWEAFEWEGKRYFTWNFTPRLSTFYFYEFDPRTDEPDECAITFLKIMLLVEQVAGGPVHVSIDVVQLSRPPEEEDPPFPFYIPSELDFQVEGWREIARRDAPPSLIM